MDGPLRGSIPSVEAVIIRIGSEIKPQRQLNEARVTAEGLIGLIELSRSSLEQAQHSGLRSQLDPVYRTGYELRVVERIVEVDAELNLHRFPDPEVLEDREVEVIDSRQLQRVATAVGPGSGAGLNVLGVGIVGHVSNHGWAAIGYGVATPVNSVNRAGRTAYPIQVDDRRAAGRVAVQVRTASALNGGELAVFECQGAGKTPPACNGSYPVPAITEQRHIIYSGQDETLTVVE